VKGRKGKKEGREGGREGGRERKKERVINGGDVSNMTT
jgi:hypothetical protein